MERRVLIKARGFIPARLPRSRRSNASIPLTISIVATRHLSSLAAGRKKETSYSPRQLSPSIQRALDDVLSKMQPEVKRAPRAYVALGSNLGDRVDWIEKACNEMQSYGIHILRTSSLWETDPMYVMDQEKFLNGVCEVSFLPGLPSSTPPRGCRRRKYNAPYKPPPSGNLTILQIATDLKPMELLDALQEIERKLGRQKIIDKGPRNIDLDILLYEDQIIDHVRLKVPHPSMPEREFVLRPLSELIPGEPLHPSSSWKTVQEYLDALPQLHPMSTVTPLGRSEEPIRALQPNRKTMVMAILNLNHDSFSDASVNAPITAELDSTKPSLLQLTIQSLTDDGARIIDIGGQSSAPQSVSVPAEEEASRIIPSIKQIRSTGYKGLLSVDTYRASVAEAAVEAGADIINDISAGQLDSSMLPTMARLGTTVILMHMRGAPNTMQRRVMRDYSPKGLIPTIAKELLQRLEEAQAAGIRRWRIILDPGIGFAKDGDDALEILRRFDELRDWPGLRGLPWLVGSSRKAFIGKITDVPRPDERQYGTSATVAAAIHGGADIVRVHDVKQMTEVAKVSDAIWRV
ncbi:uncharacterized protein BP5553_08102 [Venustampulla echinocandica]|uniref:Folic acid synthesis protein FOL1 n=1 Tax=Venustampulla echinocandica TaxID=2656787 RepID=A0A370TFQ9_9HELO|nr:uncharacterized protein BP5553_08102 [Venustampulla echinocandica]RDL33734.1 hypothetical protein BP5553_08102 [Venustampulla echinocandica]